MATISEPLHEASQKKRNLVEMNWDPITRIVGSLGIFTKLTLKTNKWPSATAPRPSSADTAYS